MAMMQTIKVQASRDGQANRQVREGNARPRWSRLLGLAAMVLILGTLFLLPFWQQAASAHGVPGGMATNFPAGSLSLADMPRTDSRSTPAAPLLQAPTTALTVSILSSPWAVLDSNNPAGTPTKPAPNVFVVEAVITNTGSTTATDVVVNLDYNPSILNNWVLVTGESPQRSIQELAPHQAYHAFWLARYSTVIGAIHQYTVTASAGNASPVTTSRNAYAPASDRTVTTLGTLSTGNSGITQVSANIVVGVAFTISVSYDLGQNPGFGVFSPVGNPDFNSGAYRLLASQVRFFDKNGSLLPNPVDNRLYFPALPGSAASAQAIFTFIALAPEDTQLCPYTGIGYQSNDKYDQFYCTGTHVAPITGTLSLSLTKQADLVVQQAQRLTYTLRYTNTGSLPLQSVWIWDDVFTATSVVTSTLNPSGDAGETSASRAAWYRGDVGISGQATSTGTLTFAALVDGSGQDLADGTALVNQAFFGVSPGSLPEVKALTDTFTTTVQAPTITLSKTDGQATAQPGDALTYSLRITNSGSMTATGLVITDTLPAEVAYAGGAEPVGGVYNPAQRTIAWTLASLAPNGGTHVLTIPVTLGLKVPNGTVLTNTLRVRYQNPAGWVYAVKTATDTTTVGAPVLSIVKRDFPDPVLTGHLITYTLRYTNTGPAPATHVLITDVLPLSTTYQTCTPSPCGLYGNVVSWTVGTVPATSNAAVSFSVLVSSTLETGELIQNKSYGISADQADFIAGPPVATTVNKNAGIIQGYAFEDANFNGIMDGGETGIPDVTVTLTAATEPVTTTNSSGAYRFRVETEGPISVTADLPADTFRTTPGAVFVDNILGLTQTINFGYAPTSSGAGVIYGTVFDDANHDGSQGLGEKGLAGVTITSTEAATSPVTTNPFGGYTLYYTSFGSTTIHEKNPAFYVSTTPDAVAATAAAGSAGSSPVDFGDFLGAKITGQVFDDANVNGANDGEAGVVGAAVAADGDSFFPTGSTGVYTLYVSVSNGNPITIVETDPANYVSTDAVPGGGMSRVDANTLRIGSPVSGTIYSGDFGDVQAGDVVTISGMVWNDNGAGNCLADGLPDCDEPGLAGAVVGLSSGLTQTTLADGAFSLYGPAGEPITVTEVNPSGGYVSTNAIPDPSHAVQKIDNDTLRVGSLTSGATSSGNLFGDVLAGGVALITGTVFNDANQNGALNGGEAGFAAIAVTLEYSDGHTIVVPTDAAGVYQFAVAPGTDVRITSATPAGSPAYYPTTPSSVVVRPPASGLFPDNNFGFSNNTGPVIYGIVFDDLNSNGIQDLGELGLAGAVVTRTDGTTVSVPTSGTGLITGTFTFPVTPTGIYGLHEQNPPGYRSTTPDNLSVNVFSPARSYFVDFGDTNNPDMASIYGTVFDDLNMNGVQDPDETGLDGVVISVTVSAGGGGSGWLTTTTKAYGQFSYGFDIYEQGYHTIQEQDPAKAGYHSTTPDEVNQYILKGNSYIVDFGDVNKGDATIMGTVFDDADGNGVQGAQELGLEGVPVSLSDGQTTATNLNGGYTFGVGVTGTVQVAETDPATYHSTTPNMVTVNVISLTGEVYTVNYGDRANSQAGVSFFGTVFEDKNVNRARDNTESGLEGVPVTIGSATITPVPATVTTNQWGQYTFLIENPETYTVTESDPAGYLSTTAIPGNAAVFRVDDNTLSTTVASTALGADLGDNLFGDVQASQAITISGTVWDDNGAGGGSGGDGQRNGSEPGLAGAVISLSSGPTQTTGSDGAFLLHAPAGQAITVTEANPAGYLSTNAIPGTGAARFDNDTLVVASTLGGGHTSDLNLFGDVLTAGLKLSKSAADVNGQLLLEGDAVRYTLQVTNTGTYTAFDVTVTDNLPDQVTCQSIAGDYAPGCADPLVWTIPSLPGSSAATLHITVTIKTGTAGQTITNTGSVTGSNVPNPPDPPQPVCPDGSLLPVSGVCPTTPVPTTTLSIAKSAADVNGPPLVEGDSVRYTLQVTNTGTYTALNVTVVDDLPNAVSYVGAAPDRGTASGTDPVIWTIPNLPGGSMATLRITATINTGTQGRTITNTGSVTSSNVPNPPDPPQPVCPDGSPLPVSGVCPTTPVPVVAPGFDKSVSYSLPLAVGDLVTYTLRITGSPVYTAFNVVVVDTWPVSVTLVNSTTTQGSAISGTGLITWTVGDLAPNATAALKLTGSLNGDTAGQIIANTGTLAGSNVAGAQDSAALFVGNCLPDAYEADNTLAQAKAFDFALPSFSQSRNFYVPADHDWLKLTVRAGAVYTFATSNLGPLADTVLSLYAEDGTTLLAENDDLGANVQDSRIVWTAPLTPLNQTVYLVVWETAYNADSCRTDYTLSLTQAVGGNLDTSVKTVTPVQADLDIGDPVTYTIALTNTDLMAAAPVTITDTLPPTITLKSNGVKVCGGTGQYKLYQYSEADNGFTWLGALDAGTSLQLCVAGTVAITPWASINTAEIRWNGQEKSVSAEGFVLPPPSGSKVYLPIIIANNP